MKFSKFPQTYNTNYTYGTTMDHTTELGYSNDIKIAYEFTAL